MKAMVFGDTHDDTDYLRDALILFEKEKYDRLYLTGDLGRLSVRMLNPYAEKIVAVEGNNDPYYDVEKVSKFPLPVINYTMLNGMFVCLTHGHLYSRYDIPVNYDILILGHTHRGMVERFAGKWILNPGSLSCPRDGYHSYLTIDERKIQLRSIKTGKVLKEVFLGKENEG